jgi:hypothetical protein
MKHPTIAIAVPKFSSLWILLFVKYLRSTSIKGVRFVKRAACAITVYSPLRIYAVYSISSARPPINKSSQLSAIVFIVQ